MGSKIEKKSNKNQIEILMNFLMDFRSPGEGEVYKEPQGTPPPLRKKKEERRKKKEEGRKKKEERRKKKEEKK